MGNYHSGHVFGVGIIRCGHYSVWAFITVGNFRVGNFRAGNLCGQLPCGQFSYGDLSCGDLSCRDLLVGYFWSPILLYVICTVSL